MNTVNDSARTSLLRRGFALEYATLGWNVVGIVVLAAAAVAARSVALAGFVVTYYAVREAREIFSDAH